MTELLAEYASIVARYTFTTETGPGLKVVERCEIVLTNASRLVTYESRKGAKFKYSYQWMTADNQTIYRWDSTPHFPDFATFPNHRDTGLDETAEPFPAVSLADVLQFIATSLVQ